MPSLLPGKTASKIQRIGVLTAGGDCPGLNAVIRAVVKSAVQRHGWQVLGIRDGFEGLISGDDAIMPLTAETVYGILARGGTILMHDIQPQTVRVLDEVISRLQKQGFDIQMVSPQPQLPPIS